MNSEAQTQAAIDRRIRDFQSDACDRVNRGEISPLAANELTNDFADRMYRDGPWN